MKLNICIVFKWQGFGSGGAEGMAPVGRDQGLLPQQTEPGPDSSKMDSSLAKVEPSVTLVVPL